MVLAKKKKKQSSGIFNEKNIENINIFNFHKIIFLILL